MLLILWAVMGTALAVILFGDSPLMAGWFGAVAAAAAGTARLLTKPATTRVPNVQPDSVVRR